MNRLIASTTRQTGNTVIGLENGKRCLVMPSNDVRAELIYPGLARMVPGDTRMP